jgi:hypothetical protein
LYEVDGPVNCDGLKAEGFTDVSLSMLSSVNVFVDLMVGLRLSPGHLSEIQARLSISLAEIHRRCLGGIIIRSIRSADKLIRSFSNPNQTARQVDAQGAIFRQERAAQPA